MTYTANQVIPGLWQGSAPVDDQVRGRWDMVVLAAKEWQPQLGVYTVIRAPMDDSELSTSEAQIALRASKTVAEAVRTGQKVLVTCHMGLNRSGLITALALRRLGHSPIESIALVRRARGDHALGNTSFVKFIHHA